MQVLSWATAAADCCVMVQARERPAGLQRHLLLLRGIARRRNWLRHLLIHLVQLAFLILQAGKFLGQILIFGPQPGVFRRLNVATLEFLSLSRSDCNSTTFCCDS